MSPSEPQPLPTGFALPLPEEPAPVFAPPAGPPLPAARLAPASPPSARQWRGLPRAHFLPDGTPLLLTLSRKLTLSTLFPDLIAPITAYECAFLLFLASHGPEAWNAPVPDPVDSALLTPLWMRPEEFKAVVDSWLDSGPLSAVEPAQMIQLAQQLWRDEHSSQVSTIADDAAEKKSPAPTLIPQPPIPSFKSPASSAETTPPASSLSSTSSPSTAPISSFTPSSSPAASA